MPGEEPLPGGNIATGVVKVGDTVRRPMGHWSPAVHALLDHLEATGFDHAPRFLGVDPQGREILSFAPGRVIWPDAPATLEPDDSLARAGEILARYHGAAASFSPPADARWWPGSLDPAGGPLLLHGDFAPWNIVVDGPRWTIIDWDSASPGRPEWELAYALHTFVPMWADIDMTDRRTVERIRAFDDGYQASQDLLGAALRLAPRRCRQLVTFLRQRAAAGDPPFARMVADGHETGWLDAADRIASRAPTWLALLGN